MAVFPKTLYWEDGCSGEHMGLEEKKKSRLVVAKRGAQVLMGCFSDIVLALLPT